MRYNNFNRRNNIPADSDKHTAPHIHNEGAFADTFDDIEEAESEAEAGAMDEATEETLSQDIENAEAKDKALEDLRAALEKEKKEYMFLMAEFDNFRKRTIREKSDIVKNASEKVLAGLLPIVDDFERGIEANRNSEDAESVKEGMELIYHKLIKFLEQNGVKAIDSTGAEFNPDLHDAIAMVPVENPDQKGKVIDTATKGYTINDKVLRHAKVAVGQ